ncbi:formylglycine-generating enzyme family protein [Bradyrhizobium sp. NP1]|uniref:formylglycine-generating enzyme family protein n=1 Tax=Bradyrhizobium sp. NP1 TaxID=3049772 RepID=UPI0025A60942|nr:formylglycine-generating enzyme family protein [Bradyrhizobium sp. NP1]WJR80813.1 formylglycine-generating enzyme family protein [Bradyrhizobium sp. NP1]
MRALHIFGSSLVLLVICWVAVARSGEQALQAGQTFRDCSECPEMVVIPAGRFLMGSSDQDIQRDVAAAVPIGEAKYAKTVMAFELPQHQVDISKSFAVGRHLVTRGEFSAFVDETGYSADGGCALWIDHRYLRRPEAGWRNPGFNQTDRDPVVCVSWRDAKAYIAWLNGKIRSQTAVEGNGPYRLPSEAEWEYAARAGTQTARWWGDAIGSGNANCDGCDSRWDKKQTSPVGSFGINPFGLADVLGNAWEWTEDCWNETYMEAPQNGSAWTTGACDFRVMRGGSWNNRPWVLRSSERTNERADDRTNYIGFRVVRTIP